jgi:hypothetical protein
MAWTQRNYLLIRRKNPEVAQACLIGTITFDTGENRLVKTFTKGLETEPGEDHCRRRQPRACACIFPRGISL